MFTMVRNFFTRVKDGSELLPFDSLDIGYEVQFGIMPQASLSVRRFRVVAVHTYVFGEEHFTSFSMAQPQGAGVNMIVAGQGESRYLALSRKISQEELTLLFDEWRIDGILHAPAQQRLQTKVPEAILRGWIAPAYRKVIGGQAGALYRGRHFNESETDAEGQSYHIRDFNYYLLVSDDRGHALEIEEYDDGKLDVYVTVFRPANDVSRVDAPVRRLGESKLRALLTPYAEVSEDDEDEAHRQAKEKFEDMLAVEELEQRQAEEAAEEESKIAGVEVAAEEETVVEEEKQEEVVEAAAEEAVEEVKAEEIGDVEIESIEAGAEEMRMYADKQEARGEIVSAAAAMPVSASGSHVMTLGPKAIPETIACNAKIASRLIDEAVRNEMSLEVVVRKVLGLSSSGNDQVLFNVNLSDDDYALLAGRYEMSPDDRDAIKRRMVEELAWFAGDRR